MSSSPTIAKCGDVEVLRTLVTDLESELREKAAENACFEAEIRTLQRKLAKRDAEILRQERELHKLRVGFQGNSKADAYTYLRKCGSAIDAR